MSVSSAGRYAIDTTNRRHARAVVAARVIATDAPAYASPSVSAPQKYNPPVSLLPTLLGVTGGLYFFGALTLGLAYAVASVAMTRPASTARPWRLFSVASADPPTRLTH